MKCKNCDNEIKRGLWCSDKCRKAYGRKSDSKVGQTELGQVGQPNSDTSLIPNFGQPDCQCKHCQQCRANKLDVKLNHGSYMSAAELAVNGYSFNRVSLPGDTDYRGCAGL